MKDCVKRFLKYFWLKTEKIGGKMDDNTKLTDELWEKYYKLIREPKIKGRVLHDSKIQAKIIQQLKNNNFRLVNYTLDVNDYKKYIERTKEIYNKYPIYGNNLVEKSLEHYTAAKLLNLSESDIYIDIASAGSPVPEIYAKLYGCKTYRQDIVYPKGINNEVIGGDAANMPVPPGFATKMAMHCSLEHFEGDSDIRLIKEVNRILKTGGKLCVLPLYLFDKYAIQTDPVALKNRNIKFEKDAIVYCAKDWQLIHGRFYDIHHLVSRIKNNLANLEMTIYIVQNEKEISATCYIKFIAVFMKNEVL